MRVNLRDPELPRFEHAGLGGPDDARVVDPYPDFRRDIPPDPARIDRREQEGVGIPRAANERYVGFDHQLL